MSSEPPVDLIARAAHRPWDRQKGSGSEAVAKANAFEFAKTYRSRVGIWARISGSSNGVYAANAPVFTSAPSDEQEVKPLSEVGEHWTCVGMVYPL